MAVEAQFSPSVPRVMKCLTLPILVTLILCGSIHAITYEEWRVAAFPVEEAYDEAVSGPLIDPDGDGRRNFLEFALNTNPKVPDMAAGEVGSLATTGHLTLHFSRWKQYPGMLYAPQVSGDLLSGWFAGPDSVEETAVVSNGAETDTVTVRDLTATSAATKRFLRLLVARIRTVTGCQTIGSSNFSAISMRPAQTITNSTV